MEEEKYERIVQIIERKIRELDIERKKALKRQAYKYADILVYRLNMLKDILREVDENYDD